MAPRYKPNTKVTTVQTPYRVAVLKADPDFEAHRRKEPTYEFSNGRNFYGDTSKLGPYSTVPNIRDD